VGNRKKYFEQLVCGGFCPHLDLWYEYLTYFRYFVYLVAETTNTAMKERDLRMGEWNKRRQWIMAAGRRRQTL
jgi:hypothetical protein